MARAEGLFPIVTCTRRDPELEVEAARAMISHQVGWLISTGATRPRPDYRTVQCRGGAEPEFGSARITGTLGNLRQFFRCSRAYAADTREVRQKARRAGAATLRRRSCQRSQYLRTHTGISRGPCGDGTDLGRSQYPGMRLCAREGRTGAGREHIEPYYPAARHVCELHDLA